MAGVDLTEEAAGYWTPDGIVAI
ncbi:uncharacterized protein G2W53_006957 [Senna tora]|uniref:Uncharacterized protein n=1 Tax=Senna tora TaxID=362788 RepID=A0A834X5U1_9FABA|nr:uncharacterized protein G2W53_006957 [Senna tora]